MRSFWAAILCLALAGCTVKKPGSIRIDPELEAMIPADTVFIVGGNIEAVRETPVYQKLLSRVPSDAVGRIHAANWSRSAQGPLAGSFVLQRQEWLC